MCPSPGPTGSSRIRPSNASEAGWRDPGDPARDSLRLTNGDGCGTGSLVWPEFCTPAGKGNPGARQEARARRRRRARWEPDPLSRLGVQEHGARCGWEGNHPQEVPGGRRARARCAPYLGLELTVGGGGRAVRRGCARGQEAEGRHQEPAPGTHPPLGGSEAWGAEGRRDPTVASRLG